MGRYLTRPLGLLTKDAVLTAIEDAGIRPEDVDGAATFPAYPEGPTDGTKFISMAWLVHNLGFDNVRWWAETQTGNVSTAIEQAAHALAHNRCNYAVVWRAMSFAAGGSYQPMHNDLEAQGNLAYTLPYGKASAIAEFAPAYMRYMKLYGAKREHLATLAVAQRKGANLNPNAHFRDTPLTFDEYMSARMIADPMCLFDCDIPVDGVAAIIMTTADRAKDLPNPPAYITGLGQSGIKKGIEPRSISGLVSGIGPRMFEQMEHTAETIGESLWSTSGLRPSDIDAAMLYDGWAPDVYFWLEGLGFCGKGEAFEFIQNGRMEIDGEFPINTFGGNLSEGRLHGMGHWVEAALQVQGRAGKRQIKKADHVAVASGLMNLGSGAILSKSPL
ncbi:thiolase C-terminal domain-containing protein [Nocardia fluminea]|uniref:thiolase C-terminal domain-containing protein n=1 Tax=Nocardia fluminea TaxID=134984 RepID=UPI003415ACE5